jgi:hypothetical protein
MNGEARSRAVVITRISTVTTTAVALEDSDRQDNYIGCDMGALLGIVKV